MRRKTEEKHVCEMRIAALAAALIAAFFISFTLGRYHVPLEQAIRILLSRLLPFERTWTLEMEIVVRNIRFPRICMACLAGCCLAAAGASYQGVFQNPMAAPDILGASGGASLGAALAIVMGWTQKTVMLCAFMGGTLTVAAVFLVARHAQGRKTVSLILAGIMVSSLCTAGTSYIKLIADPMDQLPQITYWLMGSLSGVKRDDLLPVTIVMLIGLIPLCLLRWRVNLLTLGDDEARSLGVNSSLLRLTVILCSTLVTAASVSATGLIGWVGLVIPHLCRRLVGVNYRYLMPASFIAGALFLLIVDDFSRNLLAVELPIGILTAVIGAPFFLYLICRKEKTL